MEAMRQSWTDDRLDDLNHKVDDGFDKVGKRFDKVEKRFDRVEDTMSEMRSELNMRFDSLHRTMIQFVSLVAVALIGVIATQL
jgi:hypothetical protein